MNMNDESTSYRQLEKEERFLGSNHTIPLY